MIAEILLAVTNVALLGLLAWQEYSGRKERAKFINALIARSAEQFRDLELTEKVKPIEPPLVPKEPEFTHESEISDKKFEELIRNEVA